MAWTWGVRLNGVYLSGGADDTNLNVPSCTGIDTLIAGCLTEPPEGMGLPGLRTEDITYAQRDGVKHFQDWYEPRTVTIKGIIADGCVTCGNDTTGYYGNVDPYGEDIYGGSPGQENLTARQKVSRLMQAWARSYNDVELIVFPPSEELDCAEVTPGEGIYRINYVTNPSVGTNLTSWDDEVNASIARVTEQAWTGIASIEMLSAAAGTESAFGSATGDDGIPVIAGNVYSASAYVMTPVVSRTARLKLQWYDESGALLPDSGQDTVVTSVMWKRLSTIATAPTDAAFARIRISFDAPEGAGEALYADGFMLEEGNVVGNYFDGSTANVDPDPELEATRVFYSWNGTPHESQSIAVGQTYESVCSCHDRIVNGPYAIVGRPRVAQVSWRRTKRPIADVLLRFDAVDHRMYLSDVCGTPNYSECVDIEPGSENFAWCFNSEGNFCFDAASDSWCFTQPAAAGQSVAETEINVCGTERVYPEIILQPDLVNPRIESLNTGTWVGYDGKIEDFPIKINTEEGTAFQNGVSVTHKLRGNLFMSMDPGEHLLRLLVTGDFSQSTGLATVCWRPTVLSG